MSLFRKKKTEASKGEPMPPLRILKVLGGNLSGGLSIIQERKIEDCEKFLNDLKKLSPAEFEGWIYEPMGIIYEVSRKDVKNNIKK